MASNLAYGIDFGTTNSTVAIADSNGNITKLKIDPDADNASVMRSIIYVSKDGKFLYGKPAVNAYLVDVAQGKGRISKTIFTGNYIKLTASADIHGFREDEWAPEIIEIDEFSGGRLIQALKSVLASPHITSINIFGKVYTLEEIIGGYLREMRDRANREIGKDITKAVFGRPVKYVGEDDDLAILRMKKAAEIAGFSEIEFEYEPIGAAYDYGNNIKQNQTVLVFDFGGGTLDISIVTFPDNKVLANVGNPIGGDYFNSQIFSHELAPYFGSQSRHGMKQLPMPYYLYARLQSWYEATLLKTDQFNFTIDDLKFMNTDPDAIEALRSLIVNNLSFSMYDEIDRVKKSISITDKDIFSFHAQKIAVDHELSRDTFEQIIKEDLHSIGQLIEEALQQAGLTELNIDAVATTGGSSLIPSVRNILINKFGENKIIDNDAFTSVAAGLALKAREVFS